jgi:hypothetical protein
VAEGPDADARWRPEAPDLAVGAKAIAAVAAQLGVPETVTAAEFYRTANSAG